MESAFETKEQYFEFVKQWRKSANSEGDDKLTLQHFVLYALLRGRDINKCLSATSSDSTIADVKYWSEEADPKYLSLWPFGGLITAEQILKARAISKGSN